MEETANSSGRVSLRLAQGALLVMIESERLNVYESNPFGIKCNDARKAYAELDKRDIQATEPIDWHHYVDFSFKDPDDNPSGVISDPAWALHPNNYFRLDGVFIGAVNFPSSLAWYQETLGTDIEYDFTVETPSTKEARMCCFRGVPITIYDSPNSFVQGRFCEFLTSDAASDHAYLKVKGIKVTDLVDVDGGRGFAFYDPEGREFGMIELH